MSDTQEVLTLPGLNWLSVEAVAVLSIPVPSADKSLAPPGMKQTRKHVRDARNFSNIDTRAVIKFFFPARQGAEGYSGHSDRNISLFLSRSG